MVEFNENYNVIINLKYNKMIELLKNLKGSIIVDTFGNFCLAEKVINGKSMYAFFNVGEISPDFVYEEYFLYPGFIVLIGDVGNVKVAWHGSDAIDAKWCWLLKDYVVLNMKEDKKKYLLVNGSGIIDTFEWDGESPYGLNEQTGNNFLKFFKVYYPGIFKYHLYNARLRKFVLKDLFLIEVKEHFIETKQAAGSSIEHYDAGGKPIIL